MVRFHRPDCTLAVGRSWTASTRQVHEEAGRLPCGVCETVSTVTVSAAGHTLRGIDRDAPRVRLAVAAGVLALLVLG